VETARELPTVSLVPWTDRREDVLRIEVPDEQRQFISAQSVADFLADDDEHPTFASFAICRGEVVVGLLCVGSEPGHEPWKRWMPLLVVDARHQRKGYARAALLQVVEDLRELGSCRAFGLSCAPANARALSLYESLGFRAGATTQRGEVEMWLTISPP
jgi:diamine N-acetyltransferase